MLRGSGVLCLLVVLGFGQFVVRPASGGVVVGMQAVGQQEQSHRAGRLPGPPGPGRHRASMATSPSGGVSTVLRLCEGEPIKLVVTRRTPSV